MERRVFLVAQVVVQSFFVQLPRQKLGVARSNFSNWVWYHQPQSTPYAPIFGRFTYIYWRYFFFGKIAEVQNLDVLLVVKRING